MEQNKKIGYLIISVSFALMVLCAISSRWYTADSGYIASFLYNAGIYIYQTTEDCSFCNGSLFVPGVEFLGKTLSSTVYFFYIPFKYIFFVLLCFSIYGGLLIKGVLSVPHFLKKTGGTNGATE